MLALLIGWSLAPAAPWPAVFLVFLQPQQLFFSVFNFLNQALQLIRLLLGLFFHLLPVLVQLFHLCFIPLSLAFVVNIVLYEVEKLLVLSPEALYLA